MGFILRNIALYIFGMFFTIFAIYWMFTAKDMGLYPIDLYGLIFAAAGIMMMVVAIFKIAKGEATCKATGPAPFGDYMEAQKTAKNEKEDPNASRLSTEDRHRIL